MMATLKNGLLVLGLMTGLSACGGEKLVPECTGATPTYDTEIKGIIDANCTNASCHGPGSGDGDYTSFAGLSGDLANGKFESAVLVNQSMPRNGKLSQEEINLLQCWMETGYPEN